MRLFRGPSANVQKEKAEDARSISPARLKDRRVLVLRDKHGRPIGSTMFCFKSASGSGTLAAVVMPQASAASRAIQGTSGLSKPRYTALALDRFKDFWPD